MKTRLATTLLLLFIAFFLPLVTSARGYWFEIKGSGKVNEPVKIGVCFGGIDERGARTREQGSGNERLAGFKVYVVDSKGGRTEISLHPLEDRWEGVFTPREKDVYRILGINDRLPVLDSEQRKMNIRPVQYLCALYTTAGASPSVQLPLQFMDIIVTQKERLVTVKGFKNNLPADSSLKFRIFNPENWEKTPTADEKGKAAFMTTMKGLYIIRLDWMEQKPHTYQGKLVDGIRHRCDYSLHVDEEHVP